MSRQRDGDAACRPDDPDGPQVSVLMPAWNAAATLAEAVASVREQTFASWELLIADDASTDETRAIAEALAGTDPRIRLLAHDRHEGAASARNRALAASRGRYVAFLDADDLWLPEKLERQVRFMCDTGAALSHTGYVRRRAGRADRRVSVPDAVGYEDLLRGNVIGCLTAMYDTASCGKVPMRAIPRRHDFALWLDIVKRCGPARGLDLPLAVYRVSPHSLAANKIRASADTWRMYRREIGLTRGQALTCLLSHLWRRATRRDAKS